MDYFYYTNEGDDISAEFTEKFTEAQNRIVADNNLDEFTLSGTVGGNRITEVHYGSRVFAGRLKHWEVIVKKKTFITIETFISKDNTFYYIDVKN